MRKLVMLPPGIGSPALPLATETQILALVSPAVSSWFRSFGGPWPDVVHLNARAAGRLHSETPGSARPKPTTTRLARPAGAVPTPFTTQHDTAYLARPLPLSLGRFVSLLSSYYLRAFIVFFTSVVHESVARRVSTSRQRATRRGQRAASSHG